MQGKANDKMNSYSILPRKMQKSHITYINLSLL